MKDNGKQWWLSSSCFTVFTFNAMIVHEYTPSCVLLKSTIVNIPIYYTSSLSCINQYRGVLVEY